MSHIYSTSWFNSPSLPASSSAVPSPLNPPTRVASSTSSRGVSTNPYACPSPLSAPLTPYPFAAPKYITTPASNLISPAASRRRAPPAPTYRHRRSRSRHMRMHEPARSGLFTVSEAEEAEEGYASSAPASTVSLQSVNLMRSAGFEVSGQSFISTRPGWLGSGSEGGMGQLGLARASSEVHVPSPISAEFGLPTLTTGNAAQDCDDVRMRDDHIAHGIASNDRSTNAVSLLGVTRDGKGHPGKCLSWSSPLADEPARRSPRLSYASTTDESEGAATPMRDGSDEEEDDPFFVDVPLGIDDELEMDQHLSRRQPISPAPYIPLQSDVIMAESAAQKGVSLATIRPGMSSRIKRPPPLDLRRAIASNPTASSQRQTGHPYAYAATRSIHDWAGEVNVLTPKPLHSRSSPVASAHTQTALFPPLPIVTDEEFRMRRGTNPVPPTSPISPLDSRSCNNPRKPHSRRRSPPLSPCFSTDRLASSGNRQSVSRSTPVSTTRQSAEEERGGNVDLVSALESLLASCGESDGMFDMDRLLCSQTPPRTPSPRTPPHRLSSMLAVPGIRLDRPTSVPSSALSSDDEDEGPDVEMKEEKSAGRSYMDAFPLPPPRMPMLSLSPSLSSASTSSSFGIPRTPNAPAKHSSLPPLYFYSQAVYATKPPLQGSQRVPSTPDHQRESRVHQIVPNFKGDHSFLQSMSCSETPSKSASTRHRSKHAYEASDCEGDSSDSFASRCSSLNSSRSGRLPQRGRLPVEWLHTHQ